MKPIDFAIETFESLKPRLDALRRQVYDAWRAHGPGTTRDVAVRSGIDILTFRPRTTELVQLGLVRLVEDGEMIEWSVPLEVVSREGFEGSEGREVRVSFEHKQHGTEGTYIARTMTQWQQWIAAQRAEAEKRKDGQLLMI
jgi:hypothetical protein